MTVCRCFCIGSVTGKICFIFQIYDGDSAFAPGSLWTSESPAPVFTSTGNSLFIVFKPGEIDDYRDQKHLGFHLRYFFSDGKYNVMVQNRIVCLICTW